MRSDCPQPEALLLAEEAGAGSPLHAHLQDCGRCRALLAARARFLAVPQPAAVDPQEEARLQDADRRLEAFLEEVTGSGRGAGGGGAGPVPGGPVRAEAIPLPARGGRLPRSFAWPASLAAVIVLATGFWLLAPRQETPTPGGGPAVREQVWRGDGPGRLPGARPQAVPLAAGGWRLTWTAVEGADRYEVVLLAPDLAELARLDAGAAVSLDLPAAAAPPGIRGGFFAVAAFTGARELGHWAAVPLP